jgi:hypothetical protein
MFGECVPWHLQGETNCLTVHILKQHMRLQNLRVSDILSLSLFWRFRKLFAKSDC